MAANVWNSLAGYVIIRIEGVGLERLLNRIVDSGIEIWDLRRTGGAIRLSIGVGGFYRLRGLVRGSGCRVRIVEKRGLTIFLCHMRGRYVMAFGWIAVLCALLLASRFVWFIRIEGCSAIEEAEIEKVLSDMGVVPGIRRGSLDTAGISANVMGSSSRIAWAGAELTGVVLQVAIVEAQEDIGVHTPGEPSNIYASHSGVLTSITALSGKAMYNAGDAVEEGALLISGNLGNGIYVEARGSAEAEVLHRISYTAEWTQRLKRPSGKSERCLWLGFKGKDVIPAIPPYEEYRMGEERRAAFTSILPIEICWADCHELTETEARATEEELMALARQGAEAMMHDAIPQDAIIVSKGSRYTQGQEGITCAIDAVARQNIAITGELIPDEPDGEGQDDGTTQ